VVHEPVARRDADGPVTADDEFAFARRRDGVGRIRYSLGHIQ
jgi:hypothetical protein